MENVKLNEWDILIGTTLRDIGISPHLKGYGYIKNAIKLCIFNDEFKTNVTKKLYPTVAKMNNTTSSRVERCIRHSIEVVWEKSDIDMLVDMFGSVVHPAKGKPTNSEFISCMAEIIKEKVCEAQQGGK